MPAARRHPGTHAGAWWCVALALAGCADTLTATQDPRCDRRALERLPTEVLATLPRPACLDGEWVAWPADLTSPAPVRRREVREGVYELVVGEGPPLRTDELRGYSLWSRLPTLRGVLGPYGVDCDAAGADFANLEVAICATPLRVLAEQIAAAYADLSLEGRTVRVCVNLVGLRAPRCDAPDPACGPVPADADLAATTLAPAESVRCVSPLVSPSYNRGGCTQDGDCVVTGCGNVCAHWSFAPVDYVCTGLSYAQWCGCIEGRCVWFYGNPR